MIKRINLIEKKVFSFTYLRLVQICLAVVLLNLAMISFKLIDVKRLEMKLKREKIQLTQLEVQKDEMMKKPEKVKISVGQYQELLDKIQGSPKWAKFFNDLSSRLPNTVWITRFTSTTGMGLVSLVKDEKEKKKKGKTAKEENEAEAALAVNRHFLELSGLSKELRTITEFTSDLAGFENMKNVTLEESNKEAFGYTFRIKSEIVKYDR